MTATCRYTQCWQLLDKDNNMDTNKPSPTDAYSANRGVPFLIVVDAAHDLTKYTEDTELLSLSAL